MKIAITGGSGLIGTEISNLLKKEQEITILDFNPPKDDSINLIVSFFMFKIYGLS